MSTQVEWLKFAKVMLAIESRGDVDSAGLALIRKRCLSLAERSGQQPGKYAFGLLGALENGLSLHAALRMPAKRLEARGKGYEQFA